ncbi:MAG: M23 family metallopeptidase [Bacilli bacterium]|nr:M23 family metallopeptidase [Bacilli bacterium]
MNDNDLFNKIKKYKKIAKIIGLISPVILPFFMVILVVIIVFYTIFVAYNQVGVVIESTEKLSNLITLNGWGTNKEVFFNQLSEEYNLYHSNPDRDDELDIALIVATIHYGTLIDPDVWEDANPGIFESDSSTSFSIVDTIKTGSFYSWAETELGNSKSLLLGDRGLVGALISYHTNISCKSASGILETIFNAIINKLASIVQTNQSIRENIMGGIFTGYFDYMNVTGGNNVIDYISQMINKNYQDRKSSAYDIMSMFDTSKIDPSFSCNAETDSEDGTKKEYKIPFATFNAYNDYDKYKEYLRNYFIPEYYINCEKCAYKDYSEEDKTIKTEQIIDEIFSQRNAFAQLFDLDTNLISETKYVPGASSLPLTYSSSVYNYTSYYGEERTITLSTGKTLVDIHTGLDFPALTGTDVYAIADGVVVFSGWNDINDPTYGYGQYVKLGHDIDGDGEYDYYTIYAHLSSRSVLGGSRIGGGQKIGEVGSSGYVTGAHLHLEFRDSNNQSFDPLPTIKALLANQTTIFDSEEDDEE